MSHVPTYRMIRAIRGLAASGQIPPVDEHDLRIFTAGTDSLTLDAVLRIIGIDDEEHYSGLHAAVNRMIERESRRRFWFPTYRWITGEDASQRFEDAMFAAFMPPPLSAEDANIMF